MLPPQVAPWHLVENTLARTANDDAVSRIRNDRAVADWIAASSAECLKRSRGTSCGQQASLSLACTVASGWDGSPAQPRV